MEVKLGVMKQVDISQYDEMEGVWTLKSDQVQILALPFLGHVTVGKLIKLFLFFHFLSCKIPNSCG